MWFCYYGKKYQGALNFYWLTTRALACGFVAVNSTSSGSLEYLNAVAWKKWWMYVAWKFKIKFKIAMTPHCMPKYCRPSKNPRPINYDNESPGSIQFHALIIITRVTQTLSEFKSISMPSPMTYLKNLWSNRFQLNCKIGGKIWRQICGNWSRAHCYMVLQQKLYYFAFHWKWIEQNKSKILLSSINIFSL